MFDVNSVVGKLPTPPPGLPPHLVGGGVGFAFIGWLIELKEMLHAVLDPVRNCKSASEVFWTYLGLENAHYLGIASWIAIFALTSFTLVGLVRILIRYSRRKPSDTHD